MSTPDYRAVARDAEYLRSASKALRKSGKNLHEAESLERMARSHDLAAEELEEQERRQLAHVAENGSTLGAATLDLRAGVDFREYLQTGEQRSALVVGTGSAGGYLVPEPIHAPLIEKVRKLNPIVDLATNFSLALGNPSMKLPLKAMHGAVANATETGARTEQAEPTFSSASLDTHDYYSDQRASQEWLDSGHDAESILLSWLYGDIYEQFGIDATTGDGNTKASGLFSASATFGNILSGAAGAITNTAFAQAFTTLHPKYRTDACWLMNSATLGVCMNLTSPNSTTDPLVKFAADGTPMILGRPVRECQSAPAIGAANFPIAFGDVSQGYAIATHVAPTILRDPYTATPLVRFYAYSRLGGMPWDSQAIVLVKSNNA